MQPRGAVLLEAAREHLVEGIVDGEHVLARSPGDLLRHVQVVKVEHAPSDVQLWEQDEEARAAT